MHQPLEAPSIWVCRFAPLIRAGGCVLDVACGNGRHARLLADKGLRVEAVDRNEQALRQLDGIAGVSIRVADLESAEWPYAGRYFDAIVVTNYLYRPFLPQLFTSLEDRGILIYETFAIGNERYGRPANPDFLLHHGELLEHARGRLRVLAYEELYVDDPKPALVQRICAIAEHPAHASTG